MNREMLEEAAMCSNSSCEECKLYRIVNVHCTSDSAQTALTYLNMLKRLEWETVTDNGTPYCVLCGNFKHSGHRSECELGKLLKEAEA